MVEVTGLLRQFLNQIYRMQSFRTELENPVVERDIIDLERKINDFRWKNSRRTF